MALLAEGCMEHLSDNSQYNLNILIKIELFLSTTIGTFGELYTACMHGTEQHGIIYYVQEKQYLHVTCTPIV
jgi:hypothetical protein